jgi:MinD-like ATPase involved in chromosome partitioning or flagellar assembly
MADRRVIIVDQTLRSMRDAVRVTNLFNDGMPDQRNSFVVNRVGEAGANALNLEEVEMVLQTKPASLIPFAPKLVAPAASYAEIAASKRSKFGSAVTKLSLELSGGGRQRRSWWRAK